MRPYSMDLRERVVAACDAREGSREQIAKRFGVSDRWIRKLLQQRRETGSIAPLPQNPGRKRALNDRQMERLRRLVYKRPDATLEELRRSLGVKISIAALHRAVRALDLTLKKSLVAAEQKRQDVADQRRRWKQAIADVDPSRLVFIDESGAKTNMTRLYGRAPRGKRVIEHAPGGHWCTTTMLCALRCDRIEAPLVIEGAMDSVVFRGYVEQMLVPTLHPGDVVVMDNLAPHKTLGVQEAIEATGATVG